MRKPQIVFHRKYSGKNCDKKITYLKDDAAMEEYLITAGTEGAVLQRADGMQIAGADLVERVEQARIARNLISSMAHRVPARLIEQMAIAGLFGGDKVYDDTFEKRLDAMEPEYERGWKCEYTDKNEFVFDTFYLWMLL